MIQVKDQAGEIAPTGQVLSQAPQSMQVSGSITYWVSPAEMAPVGQTDSHAPQEMQASEIL